jgi:hypothetical protein
MPSAPVEELAPVRTQPREHVLEIGCRGRAGRERGWIERPTTEREQHQCAYAASNLKRMLGNVLVRDSITGKMQRRPERQCSRPRSCQCTEERTGRDMKRHDHRRSVVSGELSVLTT